MDSKANVLSADMYDAFGARQSTSSAQYVFGFGAQYGYYTDSGTGLVLCTNRYYDPSTGRWLTRDPIGYAGGVNLYGYVGNDPVNEEDPSGLRGGVSAPPITAPGEPNTGSGIDEGPGPGSGTTLCGIFLFFEACGPANPANEWNNSPQAGADHDFYKEFCNTPVQPGKNECETLEKQIEHAEQCIFLMESWDAKYLPGSGRHDPAIDTWNNRLRKLKARHQKLCCH